MQSGEILQMGTPMELYRNPKRAEVAEFFGLVNWVQGKMVQSDLAETSMGRFQIKGSATPGSQVLLGFRPEALSVAQGHSHSAPNFLRGMLRSSTFLGDQFLYNVMIQDHPFVGKGRVIPAERDGHLCFYVDPADVMVFPEKHATQSVDGEASTVFTAKN
jgi:iron(III) transport system ATP-binding protein